MSNSDVNDADERTGMVPLSMLLPRSRVTRVVSAARLAGNAPDIAFTLKSLKKEVEEWSYATFRI